MNALSTINEFPSTFDQINKFVSLVREEILSGEYNVLTALIQLRAAQQAIELLNKDEAILESAINEYSKYGEKTVDLNGVKIIQKEVGTKYDYEACGDTEWERYKSAEVFAADSRKNRETFLKSLREPLTVVNEETGETETILPVSKTSKTTLAITLK
jgi:hypothetical protein